MTSDDSLEEKQIKAEEHMIDEGDYPKSVFLIILNEFCERFSYYGIRTVLYIYLTQFLGQSQKNATVIYSLFTVICYLTPLMGALLADGLIGLYGTILYLSIVYFIGEIVFTVSSVIPFGAPNLHGALFGLLIIAIGTGGIKPCVSAFGGNQFEKHQVRYTETFFSLFYLMINAGSTIGSFLTPILRGDVKCFGNDCYPLAFGVPSAFMLVSLIFFVIGTPFYKRGSKSQEGNVIVETFGCISRAIYRKFISKEQRNHWLDYADDKYDAKLIEDVKSFCRIVLIFVPVPLYWGLYDQQGTSWTAQAQRMNGRIGQFTITPDQLQVVNPILIITLIPIFDSFIYPAFAKINLFKKQLQRMTMGFILAVFSFLISAFLQSQMDLASLRLNQPNQIRILNLTPCNLTISYNNETILNNVSQEEYFNNYPVNLDQIYLDKLLSIEDNLIPLNINAKCYYGLTLLNVPISISKQDLPKTVILYLNQSVEIINSFDLPYDQHDDLVGSSQVRFVTFNLNQTSSLSPSLIDAMLTSNGNVLPNKSNLVTSASQSINSSNYINIDSSTYNFEVIDDNSMKPIIDDVISLESCGRYTIFLFPNAFNNTMVDYAVLTDIYPNGISMLWQLIQIFVISVSEILLSISGLSFAYSQAPETMKSVLQASWLLTVAVGNFIVAIIVGFSIFSQVMQYLIFAGLLLLGTMLFIFLTFNYKYVNNIYSTIE